MSCCLEAFSVSGAGVSIVVVSGRGIGALRATLESIAAQQLPPDDITIATEAGEVEEVRGLVAQVLPPALAGRAVARAGEGGGWDLLPALVDECAGAALAVVEAGEVLAPGFLQAVQGRFAAEDGDSIAAVAIRVSDAEDPQRGLGGEAELTVEEVLGRPDAPATCFVYRREALHRVGGWACLPPASAQWDLHLRLAAEWRIVLLPAPLVMRGLLRLEQPDSGPAVRSQQLRRLLKRAPDQLGLLLLVAQRRREAGEREARLQEKLDQVTRRLDDLAAMVARLPGAQAVAPPQKQDGERVLRVS
ncbi:hypothetical protein [Falsiroseomonas ponticola]|uniref:hypothetical protein n=1 Tax=Falsiroseomonas ponticola TaxID=2786951 RepID=UPI0019323E55|nr:hypothetical protein [Roseomonas ponticola]